MSFLKSTRKSVLATVAVSVMAFSAGGAMAETVTTTSEIGYVTQDQMLRTSDQAYAAMNQVQAARVALAADNVPLAQTALEAAKTALTNSESDYANLMMRDYTDVDSTTNYLPFDMAMGVAEGYVVTDQDAAVLQQASNLFGTGDIDAAVTTLNMSDIEVQVSTAMLPYDSTMTRLDDALGFIEDGDNTTAQLGLDQIINSVVVRDFMLDAIPAQGVTG